MSLAVDDDTEVVDDTSGELKKLDSFASTEYVLHPLEYGHCWSQR